MASRRMRVHSRPGDMPHRTVQIGPGGAPLKETTRSRGRATGSRSEMPWRLRRQPHVGAIAFAGARNETEPQPGRRDDPRRAHGDLFRLGQARADAGLRQRQRERRVAADRDRARRRRSSSAIASGLPSSSARSWSTSPLRARSRPRSASPPATCSRPWSAPTWSIDFANGRHAFNRAQDVFRLAFLAGMLSTG